MTTKTGQTAHSIVNFDPAAYEVTEYLDNQRPQYYGQDIESWKDEITWWEADMLRILGADWRRKSHRCVHCGNGRVRYITACLHVPTGETVVFGADCTHRLEFASRDEFKLARLKKLADAKNVRLKVWKARERFVAAHPEVTAAIEAMKLQVHAGNRFVADVLGKLDTWGSLSDKQVAALTGSLARDLTAADRKAAQDAEVKGDAPVGRVEVTGVVLSLQDRETDFGMVTKMLMKLPNNAKVWVSAPSKGDYVVGDTITLKATFEVSRDDKAFAFGKRPHFVRKEVA